MMRGGGETRDLAFATHLRDLGCDVTLVSVDPLLGKVRHPIRACRPDFCARRTSAIWSTA